MPPYTGDIRIQGLHVVNVLTAARALVAKLATMRVESSNPLQPELSDLAEAANRLAQFEREAKSRGALRHTTDANDLAQALDAARGLLNATAAQREVLRMSPEEVAAEFDVFSADEPAETQTETPVAAKSEPKEDDPFAVP